ncbi:hypothetical protein V8C44DRAFT_321551 [Trichoderma aethiopicum]
MALLHVLGLAGLVRKTLGELKPLARNAPTATSLLGASQERDVFSGATVLLAIVGPWSFLHGLARLLCFSSNRPRAEHGSTEHKHERCQLICRLLLLVTFSRGTRSSRTDVTGRPSPRVRDRRWASPSAFAAWFASPLRQICTPWPGASPVLYRWLTNTATNCH